MRDSELFNLRICFTLLISARFSIAPTVKITDPSVTFTHIAPIHSLFVREPNQNDPTQYVSTKPIFLGLHHDEVTFSFYGSDAPNTFFTFSRTHVDFELLYAETMAFSVKERGDIWYFRCVFTADEGTLDIFFLLLSSNTGKGPKSYRMDIDIVETYVKTDQMQAPIIEAVKDLQPARLYDRDLQDDDYQCLKKIYSITPPFAFEDTEHPISRLMFRTGDFQIARVKDKVVLKLSACTDSFYIFYFRHANHAKRFEKFLSLASLDSLDLPRDLQKYVDTGCPNPLWTSLYESQSDLEESQPSRKQSRPDQGSSMKSDCEDERPKRRKPRAEFSEHQLKRLRQEFKANCHPTKVERHQLALELGLQTVEVKTWFQNERNRGGKKE